MKRVLITGSRGFIGSHLLAELYNMRTDVRCLLHATGKNKNSFIHTQIKCFTINLLDLNCLLNCDAFNDVQYIFHLTGITKGLTKRQFFEANVIPTRNLLETVRLRNLRLQRFVFLSSQAAGGPATSLDLPKTPDDPSAPIEYYGCSKLEAELLVKKYSRIIPITILRPSAVYGPGDRDFLKLFKMINTRLQVFWGNKDNFLSIIFVKDLIDGILKATFSENSIGKTYYLCNDISLTWEDLINILFAIMEKRPLFTINLPSFVADISGYFGQLYSLITKKHELLNLQKVKLGKPKYWICSNQCAKEDFGFETQYSIEDGLRITFDWYKRNRWIK
ncbi:MAG: NAD(P)-dependent oxidoreductase [Nitrospirae bacterium]|nr:NAD(P)-dependent oxidoreductase [Nitrospirota bacterium]